MKIYEFGDKGKPDILLLPGTCCHWKLNFGEVIPLLERDFHVLCVSYDGFDETENSVFPYMLNETERIEEYIKKHCGGNIHAAYGCSLGGSFVGLLVQRKNIHINHAVLGSSDLDQDQFWKAKLKCAVAVPLMYRIVSTGEYPKIFRKIIEKKRTPYRDKFMKMFGIGNGGLPFIKKESVQNQFLSDLITPLDENISVTGTAVHCFYAKRMGEQYLSRYQKYFKDPLIHEFDMEHEELLVLYPERYLNSVFCSTFYTFYCGKQRKIVVFV